MLFRTVNRVLIIALYDNYVYTLFKALFSDKEKIEFTTFVKCQAKGKQAEYITKYFKSGNRVIINGQLRNNSFKVDDKNYTTLIVQVVSILQNTAQ